MQSRVALEAARNTVSNAMRVKSQHTALQEVEKAVADQVGENEHKLKVIDQRIHEINGPWYAHKEGDPCGPIISLLLTRETTA